jgi:F-type H+-transporting ATPase subunit b
MTVAIDWLTVGAQVVNFLVLVYLLKRFLYGPIVRAMAGRERAMAEQIGEVERRERDAEAEARRHREAQEALQAQRERLLARAREEAEDLRDTLDKKLRREIDELRASWRAEIEREQDTFVQDIRRHATRQFEALARRALADLASAELESQMARVLVERLGDLGQEPQDALRRGAASGEPIRVRSAFELPAAVRRSLASALQDTLGREVEVLCERSDDVVCGIELRGGGQSVAWSLDAYLDTLERRLADEVGARAGERDGGASR